MILLLPAATADLLALLTDDSGNAAAEWEDLKAAEPVLRQGVVQIELMGSGEPQDIMPLAGVMRLIQAVDSPRAERLRGWLAKMGAQHLEEEADPELAVQRMKEGKVKAENRKATPAGLAWSGRR